MEQKKPKIIVVFAPGQEFIENAICEIIKQCEYSLSFIQQIADNPIIPPIEKTDFIVISMNHFSKDEELEADLIFTNFKEEGIKDGCISAIDQILWMKSIKHAYCMNEKENPMGLHNYNNLRNFIMPMQFKFQKDGYEFTKLNPSKLIEALRPVESKEIKTEEIEQKS